MMLFAVVGLILVDLQFRDHLRTEQGMGFVNRAITRDDVERYELKRLKRVLDLDAGVGATNGGIGFTVDDGAGYFLLLKEITFDADGLMVFSLCSNNECYELGLKKSAESSIKLNERPFRIVWDLVYIHPDAMGVANQAKVLGIAKRALAVYGYRGIDRQIADTIVAFNF
jgi:hypothetical protein